MFGGFQKEALGALSVAIALVAYGIYGWQTFNGSARPHPLSWLIFGILTGTGYWVQVNSGAGPGGWVMGVTAATCLMLAGLSVVKGERKFAWREWMFLFFAAIVFVFYLWTREPAISAILATAVDVLGYGPTITKSWERPHSDSITSFGLNSIKFIPSLFAMDSVSIATMVYPSTLIVVNAVVAAVLWWRRIQVPKEEAAGHASGS